MRKQEEIVSLLVNCYQDPPLEVLAKVVLCGSRKLRADWGRPCEAVGREDLEKELWASSWRWFLHLVDDLPPGLPLKSLCQVSR